MRTGNIRKLSEEEIQERLAQYAKKPDHKIRDEIVLQYANLVESIGRRFMGACEPLEDLVQEGYIGLIASVDKYDASKQVKFSTYATHFIIGQIKHYLRDKGKIIKEPAWLQELNQRMTRVIESLHQQYGRQPTEKEIADVMKMPEKTVRELLTTREVFKVTSLDGDKDTSAGNRDTEKIKDQKVVTFQLPIEDKIVLETALDRLKDIEQHVIADHFYRGLNQTEIAKKLNISCNYVSHILRNGTKKLKKILTTDEIRDAQMQRALVSRRTGANKAETSKSEWPVIDPVTGLFNHDYLLQRLDEEISRAFRGNYKVVFMLLNVCLPDDVDSYVRLVRMDDVLYTIGQSVRNCVRKVDVVGRMGESCFGLILPNTTGQHKTVSNRIRDMVSSIQIESGKRGKKITASVHFGVAKYPAEAQDSQGLIQKACEDLGITFDEITRQPEPLDRAA